MLTAAGFSECGPVRSTNQDSIFIDCHRGLFIVADGMGGLERGKEISSAAIDLFANCLSEKQTVDGTAMLECLTSVNLSLFEDSRLRGSKAGTTFTAIQARSALCGYIHIGDSRLYHFDSRSDRLRQMTVDHSLSAELERSGTNTTVTRQFRHILTRSMGTNSLINATVGSFRTSPKDALLLCSDGFWQLFTEDELADYLRREEELSEVADAIKARSLSRNPQDNFSFVIVRT